MRNELLTQATANIKTIKKGFTFLIAPEKNNAKSMPKIIENPIINASSRLNLNLILFVFHLLMKNIFPKTFQFV